MKSALKSSKFKKSGPKSVGGTHGNVGKDITKQLMVERKENQRALKKAIEKTELKFDKKLQRLDVVMNETT